MSIFPGLGLRLQVHAAYAPNTDRVISCVVIYLFLKQLKSCAGAERPGDSNKLHDVNKETIKYL